MIELKQFAHRVKEMRSAQKMYFEQIKKAKATKNPEAFKDAKETLNISKKLEALIDDDITEIERQVTA